MLDRDTGGVKAWTNGRRRIRFPPMPEHPAVTIRPARPAELPHVLALLDRVRLPRDGLPAHEDGVLVAATERGEIVGCAALECYPDGGLLRSVAVAPGRRGAGLGQRLTAAALDLARARGVRTVYLLTETAGDFFPRFGFRRVTRDAVAPGVRRSVEFTSACPASAQAMALELTGDAGA